MGFRRNAVAAALAFVCLALGFAGAAAGASGSVTLSALTANIAAPGGSGAVQVIAPSRDFAWSAASNASWLTILSGAAGTGTATITYFASANNSSSQRTGVITIADQTFTVIQSSSLSSLNLSSSTLTFNYQIGDTTPPAQTITASSSVAPTHFTASASSAGSWLFVTPASGVTSALLSIFVSPQGLAAGTYSGAVTVTASGSTGGSQTANVTLIVTGGTSGTTASTPISATPASLSFSYQSSGAQSPAQIVSVTAPTGAGFSVTASSNGWLNASPTVATVPATVTVSVSAAGLSPGTYTGSVSIAASTGTQNIPVTLTVTAASAVAVSPSALAFSGVAGSAISLSQTLSLSGGLSGFSFTASASSPGNWLSLSATSGTLPGGLTVSANPSGLAVGNYSGTVTITTNTSQTAQVPVTLALSGANPVTVNPANLTINYQIGDPNPSPPSISLSGVSLGFTATASSSGNWLAVNPASGSIPATLTAQIAPAGLAAGTYSGAIQIAVAGAVAQTVTVSLTVVSAQSLTLSPASLTFTYQTGGSTPAPQNITVGCPNSALAFRPTASSTGSWLSVTVPSAQSNNQVVVPRGESHRTLVRLLSRERSRYSESGLSQYGRDRPRHLDGDRGRDHFLTRDPLFERRLVILLRR